MDGGVSRELEDSVVRVAGDRKAVVQTAALWYDRLILRST